MDDMDIGHITYSEHEYKQLEADRDRLQKELDDVWLSFAMAASRQDVGGAQEEYNECCDRWKKERE